MLTEDSLRSLWIVCALVLAHGATAAPAAPAASLARAARSILGAGQGAYVEAADGTVLLQQAAGHPVHPASVSKIATTLALLREFGPEHCFRTVFASEGVIRDGTLQGDLWVQGENDPALVDEDALLIAARLNALGIRRVAGALRVHGALTFNWQSDPQAARLARALTGGASEAAWTSVRALAPAGATDASPPAIELAGAAVLPARAALDERATPALDGHADAAAAVPARTLIVHCSQPLLPLLKSLNDYSNNIFKPFADAAGGAQAVQNLARSLVPAGMSAEIVLGDGAGTDPRNRLSPRAAVKLLRALELVLAASGHTLADVLPVAGVDQGTLHERLDGAQERGRVVGKTGTFGDYGASALVGAIRTRARGTVYFAILDHGIPVREARHRQDRAVRLLLAALPGPLWPYTRDVRPAAARAQLSSGGL